VTARKEVLLQEEQIVPAVETVDAGSVRAKKRVETQSVQTRVDRGSEHADLRTAPAEVEDDGEVWVLEDGSVSVPVFEEEIVITKRLVVRERVVIAKHTVYEDHVVTADLRREHLDVEADDTIADRVHLSGDVQ
jgi:uncharacterized protein (TIGR02271 family)